MRPRFPTLSALLVLATASLAAPAAVVVAVAQDQAMVLPVDPVPLVAKTADGDKRFSIEVADDQTERSAGLMFRQTMPDDHGMLFVFEATQPVGFWMKNTPMPLDLVFIGQDGVVRDVEQGEPFSEATISPDEPVRFVLELKAGTAGRLGIARGTDIVHPAIDQSAGASNPG